MTWAVSVGWGLYVPRLMAIESYAVHQMVSTVEGQLHSECDVFDLVESAFPVVR